jgi:hypothetical protein
MGGPSSLRAVGLAARLLPSYYRRDSGGGSTSSRPRSGWVVGLTLSDLAMLPCPPVMSSLGSAEQVSVIGGPT